MATASGMAARYDLGMARKLVAVAVGLAVLVLTPYYVFFADHFDYGEPELRAAIEGTWQLTMQGRAPITLELREARASKTQSSRGWVRSAAACSHRSLVRSAEACMDSTQMDLAVTVTPADATATGQLGVNDTSFRVGQLQLFLQDFAVEARVTPDGTVTDAIVFLHANGESGPMPEVAATMVRTAR
jgi:hypothetical protein